MNTILLNQILKDFKKKFVTTRGALGGIGDFWKLKPTGSFVSPKDVESFLSEAIENTEKATAQECYLQCLAVESGEGECAIAIKTKFNLESLTSRNTEAWNENVETCSGCGIKWKKIGKQCSVCFKR